MPTSHDFAEASHVYAPHGPQGQHAGYVPIPAQYEHIDKPLHYTDIPMTSYESFEQEPTKAPAAAKPAEPKKV